MNFTHIGLYGRFLREDIRDLAEEALSLFARHGAQCFVPQGEVSPVPGAQVLPLEDFLAQVDILCSIGGDGTFLRAADLIKDSHIPIIGINKGTLGFLAEIEAHELASLIPRLLQGDFSIDPRMRVEGEVRRNNQVLARVDALNDLVFSRDPMQNTVACDVFYNGQYVDSYKGDGMIFASPTGSTGYSLSAGGPLIYPGTECMIINAICPHQLGASKVIVPAQGTILVDIGQAQASIHLFADGQYITSLQEKDQLQITKSKTYINLIHIKSHPFFRAVHEKLLKRPHKE